MSAAVDTPAPECVVTIDDRGRVVEFDPAAAALFGWSRDEAVGLELSELFVLHDYGATHRDGILDTAATGRARCSTSGSSCRPCGETGPLSSSS